MPQRTEDDLQRLLAEEAFVRALAQQLVVDDADEVVQQTYLRALQHGGKGVHELRNWLARIVRNVAANLRRDNRRRQDRQRAVAMQELVPSSAELAEREERRRTLVAAVDALPPSLRTVVLLRWFDGMPPRRQTEGQRGHCEQTTQSKAPQEVSQSGRGTREQRGQQPGHQQNQRSFHASIEQQHRPESTLGRKSRAVE